MKGKRKIERELKKRADEQFKQCTVTLIDILGEEGMRQLKEEKAAVRSYKRKRWVAMIIAASLAVLIFALPTILPSHHGGNGQYGSEGQYGSVGGVVTLNEQITFAETTDINQHLPQEIAGWKCVQDKNAVVDGTVVGILREYSNADRSLNLFYSSSGHAQFTLEEAYATNISGMRVQYMTDNLYLYATWLNNGEQYCIRAFMPLTTDELMEIVGGLS